LKFNNTYIKCNFSYKKLLQICAQFVAKKNETLEDCDTSVVVGSTNKNIAILFALVNMNNTGILYVIKMLTVNKCKTEVNNHYCSNI